MFKEVDDLKMAFNALSERVRDIASWLLRLKDRVSLIDEVLDSLEDDLDLMVPFLKAYAKVVGIMEVKLARGESLEEDFKGVG
jgi:DNA anti-recombination protein RmuC